MADITVENNVVTITVGVGSGIGLTPITPSPAGSFGAATITVDAYGRVTSAIGNEIVMSGDVEQRCYTHNANTNSIDSGGFADTISGGGSAGSSNLIRGASGVRTISGGYDNIIGRSGGSDTAIASTISGGAHHRIRRPNGATGDISAFVPANAVPPVAAQSGPYPDHGVIGGGGFHYISNGTDGVIGGGYGNGIYACVATGQANDTLNTGTKSAILGGYGNAVGSLYAIVVGGETNKVEMHHSFIGGGANNLVNGAASEGYAFIGGGASNRSSRSQYAVIGGGTNNAIGQASLANDWGSYSVIAGGLGNAIATTSYAWGGTIAGGWYGSVTNQFGSILGGQSNTASATHSTVLGGQSNTAQAAHSTASGRDAVAAFPYQHAHGHEKFEVAGDCQTSLLVLKATTTNDTLTPMLAGGTALTVPAGTTWAFRSLISCRGQGANASDSAGFELSGVVENVGGTVTLISTPTKHVLGRDHAQLDVDADVSGGALRVLAKGLVSGTFRWCARLEITQVA